jgi:exosome complex component RRP42
VTLLIISAGDNIIFDPSREEIAVADSVLAVSIGREDEDPEANNAKLKLLSIRTIDPPSRLTQPGVPDSENATTLAASTSTTADEVGSQNPSSTAMGSGEEVPGVWRPRRGGVKRSLISRMVKMVLEKGGVGEEVMEGLEGVEVC